MAFTLSITVVLARLLSPTEFGLVGMVTVLTGFANSLIDFGFGNALIYKSEISEVDKSSVFWTNLFLSIIIALSYIAMSGRIAAFYGEDRLGPLTIVLSSLFIINAIAIVNRAVLHKALDFKIIFKINLISQFIAGVISILLAINGFGYWAIVFQIISSSGIASVSTFYFVKWYPKFLYSRESVSDLFKYSWGLVGNNSLNYWVRNIDNLLIGKFIGTAELGIYSKSYAILTLPMRSISDVVSRVLFPSLSQLKGSEEKIRDIYFKVCRTIMLMVAPLMVFIFVQADLLINLVFGDQWLSMVPIVRIFAVLAINQSIGTLISNLYMAHGRTKEMFYLGTVLRIMLIGSIFIGLQWGITGVAIAYTIASYISSYINHAYVGRFSGFTVSQLTSNLSLIIVINICLGALMFLFRIFFEEVFQPFWFLATCFISYALFYFLSLSILREAAFFDVKLIVKEHLKTP